MSLVYERHGAGPPLVLLHGVGHRRQAWNAVVDRLTVHREVILVDLPGHGDSPPLVPSGGSVAVALAEAVLGVFDELRLDRPHVAGNSLGGRLALEAGVAGRAASVTALSPAGFWRRNAELRYATSVFAAMRALGGRIRPFAPRLSRSAAGRAVMYATIVSRPGRLSPEQARDDMDAFMRAGDAVRAILAEPSPFTGTIPDDIPVTIAWGSRDWLLFPGQAGVARARLPNARHVPLPGCGHVPMTDDPDLVAEVLLRGSDPSGADSSAADSAGAEPTQNVPSESVPSESVPSESVPSGAHSSAANSSAADSAGAEPTQSVPSESLPSERAPTAADSAGAEPTQSVPSEPAPSAGISPDRAPAGGTAPETPEGMPG